MDKRNYRLSELIVVHAHLVKQLLHIVIETIVAFKIFPEKLQISHVFGHWTSSLRILFDY